MLPHANPVGRRQSQKARIVLAVAVLSLMGTLSVSSSPSWGVDSSVTEFSSENLTLVEDAEFLDSGLRLNPAEGDARGAAWTVDKPSIADGFETSFEFKISKPGGLRHSDDFNDGADGLAFVIQNSNDSAIGGYGHGIGYEGIPNSLAVEMDTWWNNPSSVNRNDPNGNHISIHTRGEQANSAFRRHALKTYTFIPNLTDFQVHTLRIVYSPGRMSVFLDDLDEELFSVKVNLTELLDLDQGTAWIGFTAATATAWENHDIVRWSFSTQN